MKIIPPQKLWQWDINKKVYISGITDADEWQVHFATDDDRTALVLPIKHDDSGYWAYIPNQLVSEGRLLLCYLYNQVEDWAHTETMIKIPVQRRPKPAGYTLVLTDIETRGSLREDIGSLSSLTTQTQDNLVDAINEVNAKQHNDLDGRDAADVHPMSSITGLEKKLQSIDSVGTGQAKAIAQLKQDIKTNEETDTSQSQAISSMRQSISSIQSASESNAAAISDMQVSISSINDVDYIQSQAIADAQSDIMRLIDQDAELLQDIEVLANADIALVQEINSLSGSVDSAFAEVKTALDKKQPVGEYVTSVNGTTPDEGGNVEIDVQTYTAGEGIDISESGEIAVTNPMDDKQVSAGTTWSSLNIIQKLTTPFTETGNTVTCYPVEGSPLYVVSDITAVQEGEGDPSPENIRPISGWDGANLVRSGQTYTADFGETVYGGTLDWSTGVLTVTWVKADLSQPYYYPTGGNGVRFGKALDDNYNKNTTALCSHGSIVENFSTHGFIIGTDNNNSVYAIGLLDDLGLSSIEEYKTWAESNTIELYYKTNRPYTIQLTPAQILAISGLNTIYCDTGDITVTGYEDPRHTVAKLTSRIAALESAASGI